MIGFRRKAIFLVILVLLIATLSCSLTQQGSKGGEEPPEEPTPTATEAPIFPEEDITISEPGGAVLAVAAGAMSDDVEVAVENIGEGVPFAGDTPLSAASAEYFVDLGEADQVGEITMTVPLNGDVKQAATTPSHVYLTWTEPIDGVPSVVGAIAKEGEATFPIVGQGKYQVFKLLSHEALMEIIIIFDPLAVPTYPQRTPAWCSPTAMTNLVQFHSGSWPAGGYGNIWGESSNWYLAGKAGQAYDAGYFFHWLLGAGGYTVPANVKQSFSDGNVEVIIWNWKALVESGFSNPTFANILFNSFQAYVEHYVWGDRGDRRPVAWGSSLDGHSRTITGSNGTELYYNDPGSGSHNSTRTWEDYRQMVLDSLTAEKIEVIDTVVLNASARPEAERSGVIWLLPRKDDGFPGSVALIAGGTGAPATNWHWDGAMSHEMGYFHEDLRGLLPTDPLFDSQFKATHYQDEVEFGFAVFNISDATYDFTVNVALFTDDLSIVETVGVTDTTVAPGTRENFFPAGSFKLYGLPPGLYILKFHLSQDSIFQDMKYVQFRVAESDLIFIQPSGVLVKNAFCRKGPDPKFDDVTAFVAGTELDLVGLNSERTWGKFEAKVNEMTFQCWISLTAVEVTGEENAPILVSPPLPEPELPVCTRDLDRAACNEAGGTFVVGIVPYCQCPE